MTEIREMIIEWDSSYTSSLRRGYIVALFEERGIFDAFKKEHWPFGNTPTGETYRRRYLRIKVATRPSANYSITWDGLTSTWARDPAGVSSSPVTSPVNSLSLSLVLRASASPGIE